MRAASYHVHFGGVLTWENIWLGYERKGEVPASAVSSDLSNGGFVMGEHKALLVVQHGGALVQSYNRGLDFLLRMTSYMADHQQILTARTV